MEERVGAFAAKGVTEVLVKHAQAPWDVSIVFREVAASDSAETARCSESLPDSRLRNLTKPRIQSNVPTPSSAMIGSGR